MNNFLREHLTFDQAGMVVESTDNATGGKDLFMKGICIQGGVRNANQRVYPVNEIGRAVKTLNDQVSGGYSVLGEVDHPEGLNINLSCKPYDYRNVDGWPKRLRQVKNFTYPNGAIS